MKNIEYNVNGKHAVLVTVTLRQTYFKARMSSSSLSCSLLNRRMYYPDLVGGVVGTGEKEYRIKIYKK